MSKDLKIQVLLSAMDKMSSPFKSAQSQVNKLAQSLKQNRSVFYDLKKAYEQNETQIKKYANTLNPLKAKLRENTASLKQAYAEVRRMETAMKGMANPTTAFVKRLEQAKKTVSSLQKEQSITAQKLKAARSEFSKNGFEASKMSQRQTELRRKMREANQAIDQQRQKLDALNKKSHQQATFQQKANALRAKAEQFANIGGRATATYANLKEKVAVPVSSFAKAESASTNLKVAMMGKDGKVSAEFEKINQLATQLGNKLPGNAADFQDLMTMLIRQGMSAQTILGGTGEAAAYLAVQLEMPPKQAAEFAAKMQDATRATEADMMDLMDIIQKGFYAGVDPTNMLGAYKNLAGAMDVLKVKGIEGAKVFAPLVAQLDQAGMDGSAAGNALRKIFQRSMDNGKIQKALEDLKGDKLISKKFNLNFTNGKGEFGGMDQFFKELSKLNGLSTEARLQVIKEIFGDNAEVIQALTSIIDKGKAGYDDFTQKLEEQATLRQRVEAQLQTLTNVWDAASGTFINLMAGIGEAIAPQLKVWAEYFGEISEKILVWVKANPKLTAWIMGAAVAITGLVGITGILASAFSFLLFPIRSALLGLKQFSSALSIGKVLFFGKTLADGSKKAGLLAKAGDFLSRVWNKLPNIFSFVAKSGKWVFSSLVTGFRLVGVAIAANPIGFALTAIATVLMLLYANWDTVKNAISKGWNHLKTKFADSWFVKAIEGIIYVINNWDTVVSTVTKSIGDKFDSLKKKITELWDGIGKSITNAFNKTTEFLGLETRIDSLSDSFKKLTTAEAEAHINAIKPSSKSAEQIQSVYAYSAQQKANDNLPKKWSGGFTGHGGKYEPAGIVHRGEYVMTKEATARLGVANLNRLNYGGVLGMAAVASTMATAQPMPAIKVDNRPPIASQQLTAKPQQAVNQNITITINASPNQSEAEIARQVEKALQAAQQRANARNRSSLRDRG